MKIEISRGKVPAAKKVLIYGTSGIGKSTLAACFPNTVFIDTEGSTRQLTVGRLPEPQRWEDIINEIKWAAANPAELDTLVVDTIDWAEPMATTYVCQQKGLKDIESAGYGKGYTYLADEIKRFLRLLDTVIEAGINVVLVAHSQMRKVELPDEMGAFDMYDLKTQKRTAPLYKEWADMVLFCNYKTVVITDQNTRSKKAQGGKRVMYTTHTPQWDAKNRFDLPDELPMEYIAIEHIFLDKPEKLAISEKPVKENPAKEWAETQEKAKEPQEPKVYNRTPPALSKLMKQDGVQKADLMKALVQKGYLGSIDDKLDEGVVAWLTQPETWKVVVEFIKKQNEEQQELPF